MDDGVISLKPVQENQVLKDKVYQALRKAISEMDIYATEEPPRLDERSLGELLGVSRTPVREALSRLEQEGLVQNIPRRGYFVVRKSKREILEMTYAWAALESMAARLITRKATDEQISRLRELFSTINDSDSAEARIDEYSELNIRFHQTLIGLCENEYIINMTNSLFVQMRAIRRSTIQELDRASRSIIDHMHIIEALEQRNTELAEKLVRDHTLELARHIEKHVNYLD